MQSISVSALVRYLQTLVTGDPMLRRVRVEGEIVNLTRRANGYVYFTLKDRGASVPCVDFQHTVPASQKDGDHVVVEADSNVYPAQGKFQLRIRSCQVIGRGAQLEALERLTRQLASEGLFDDSRKRKWTNLPKRIGLITSREGAVLHDFANEVHRRYPLCEIRFVPSLVQGANAPESLTHALFQLYRFHEFLPLDVIVLGRGGGSGDDLSAFNAENVVRAIATSPVPVISAVGHQVDFSLTDRVADGRASTPTEAAVLITPDRYALHQDIDHILDRALSSVHQNMMQKRRKLEQRMVALQQLQPRLRLLRKKRALEAKLQQVKNSFENSLRNRRKSLEATLQRMGKIREEQLQRTVWQVTDLSGSPQLPGALQPQARYRLLAGHHQYQILVESKEEV